MLASKLALYSQLILLATTLICIAIVPRIFFSTNQGGVSNYGTFPQTALLFSLGYWASTILLALAALRLKNAKLKRALFILASGIALMLLSTYPYKINVIFENIHVTISIGVLLLQLGVGFWLAKFNRFDRFTRIAFGIQMIGLGLGILTMFEIFLILFSAQIVGSIGLGMLLVHSVKMQEEKSS